MDEKSRKSFDVVMAGLGGQGLLTMGRLLAEAGVGHYEHVVYFPSYASSMRGGECECVVTLSNHEVSGYGAYRPSAAIILGPQALGQYEGRVVAGGLIVLDSSVISETVGRSDTVVVQVPAAKTAAELGSPQVANLVLLGAYLEVTGALPLRDVESALERRMAGSRRKDLLALNRQALKAGAAIAANRVS